MEIDTGKIAQDAINMIAEKIKNLKTLNIIVAGKTGVGKSTLINAVFRDKLAETGIGKPCTPHMRKLSKKGVPLNIFDTRGFELGKDVQKEVKKEILDTIRTGLAAQNINEAIHCIWYCINTASNRVEPEEIEWLRELSNENEITKVPIIVVLTQSFSKSNAEALKKVLQEENLNVTQIVPVLALDFVIDGVVTIPSYGLDVLIQVMGEVLPDELLDTLQNVQIANLAEKRKKAQAVVVATTATAIAEAAVPIPLADSAMLIPTQVGMIASITVVFGFDVNKSILTALLTSTLGAGGTTLLGKLAVTSILKWIPGVGSVAGAAISASVAATLTAALGEAYIGIMSLVFNGEMSIDDLASEKGKETMTQLFKTELKKKR